MTTTTPATSMLTDTDGRPMTYAVVNADDQVILGAADTIQQAMKLASAMPCAPAVHNLTHSKCPDWLKAAVKADPAYCAARAADFQRHADGHRRAAQKSLDDAAAMQALADAWKA